MKFKRGQVTIFVIVALLLVAGIVGYFIFRGGFVTTGIPPTFDPVYSSFLSCLEEDVSIGLNLLGFQGGYIYLPEFESGSTYAPFSSQLDFLGNPIPYWYYTSQNNLPIEQVPKVSKMEEELERFVNEKIRTCVFDSYYERGFEVGLGEPEAKVDIRNTEVELNLDLDLNLSLGEENVLIRNHNLVVNSNLGKLYSSAIKIYNKEQSELFLENYGLDTLHTYAPVDGIELTCSPLSWNAEEIFNELKQSISANTLALRGNNNDFSLTEEENKYFVLDLDVDEDVRFLNSPNWSFGYDVYPSEGPMMISYPVGLQQGLGVLGFCYVPYHFVYNLKYPVLVQVSNGDELFQFPMAVVIDRNKPREANVNGFLDTETFDVCPSANTLMEVMVFDMESNPVEANISYSCFGETCRIGQTGLREPLVKEFPQCGNGYIIAEAEGYKTGKYLYSVLNSGSVDLYLEKLYSLDLDLVVGTGLSEENAIISFVSEDDSQTVVYPTQREVELSEGTYEVQVYAYKNSSIRLDPTQYEQCYEVPRSGFGGLFGLTEKKCVDINIPAQIISNALYAGGKQVHYIVESDLKGSSKIVIKAESLPTPRTLEELQKNYLAFEEKGLDIEFK